MPVVVSARDAAVVERARRTGCWRGRRPTRVPSGENFANISDEAGASPPSCRSRPDWQVEHPVVAAGVLPPHLGGVREHEQPRAVGRPRVVADGQRRVVRPGGSSREPRHQHASARRWRRRSARCRWPAGRSTAPRWSSPSHRAASAPARRPAGVGAVLEDAAELGVERGAIERPRAPGRSRPAAPWPAWTARFARRQRRRFDVRPIFAHGLTIQPARGARPS